MSKWWIAIFLLPVAVVMYWMLGHVSLVGKTWFVSCPMRYSWRVDRAEWSKFFGSQTKTLLDAGLLTSV